LAPESTEIADLRVDGRRPADGTGLFLVGSVLVGLALLVGGVIASGSGYPSRRLVQRLRSPDRRQ
jgi:hypothetical protein